ncbi:putative ferric reductase transmembrane component-like protein [Cladobotryum mycophilum]|uniref:Ferric reductase transmembrane component-like protein n=1 Tax=Cladobotryum mycophilum TaxID=491253 RepID=A0ABR0S5I9_9HYPO
MVNKLQVLALRSKINWRQMNYFIAAMAGLAGLFILFHLSRRLGHWLNSGRKGSPQPKALVALSRKSRNLLLRKVPFLPSGGHAVIVTLYVAINLTLLFTNVNFKYMPLVSDYGARTGWLAIGNLVVLIFLALKNTPLAFLTAWSYERLNVLHQVAGYMTVIFVIVHGSCYAVTFVSLGSAARLAERKEVYGEIAGVAFVLMGVTGALVRKWWYELFYVVHITLWMLAVVMVSLHQPEFGHKILIAVIVAACMWALDRLIRAVRLLVYSANNSVTLTPLPNGATRVSVKKAPYGAASGEHCFLWIPKIRTFETHPFTIAAMEPLEFVVSSHDGFTRDLHRYAVANPGATLKASVEGSYGTMPNPKEYDTVLLVAGGSGATFTFGSALDMLKKLQQEEKKNIIFVWIVKYESQLAWFATHLDTLEKDDRVTLQLYITRSSRLSITSGSETPAKPGKAHIKPTEIYSEKHSSNAETIRAHRSSYSVDSEKSLPYETDSTATPGAIEYLTHTYDGYIRREKPDVSSLVRTAIEGTPADHRILVMGCGPDGLMNQVRNTTADCIRTDGPGVELHCEQFGW